MSTDVSGSNWNWNGTVGSYQVPMVVSQGFTPNGVAGLIFSGGGFSWSDSIITAFSFDSNTLWNYTTTSTVGTVTYAIVEIVNDEQGTKVVDYKEKYCSIT
jgi:hypothetical protein